MLSKYSWTFKLLLKFKESITYKIKGIAFSILLLSFTSQHIIISFELFLITRVLVVFNLKRVGVNESINL